MSAFEYESPERFNQNTPFFRELLSEVGRIIIASPSHDIRPNVMRIKSTETWDHDEQFSDYDLFINSEDVFGQNQCFPDEPDLMCFLVLPRTRIDNLSVMQCMYAMYTDGTIASQYEKASVPDAEYGASDQVEYETLERIDDLSAAGRLALLEELRTIQEIS